MRRKIAAVCLALVAPVLATGCFTVQHRYRGPKHLTTGPGLHTPTRVVRHFEVHDRQFFWLHGGVPVGEPLDALGLAAREAGAHPGVVNLRVSDGQDFLDVFITHIPCLLSMLCGTWSAWAEGDVVEYTSEPPAARGPAAGHRVVVPPPPPAERRSR